MNYYDRLLNAIYDAGARCVVCGEIACAVHGWDHITYLLSICYNRSRENIQRIVKAIQPFHPRLRGAPSDLPFLFDAETIRRGLNFTLTTDLGDLDLLGEVQGIGKYKDVLARSTALELFGREFNVLSLEGLSVAKRSAGRPRDLAVLPELEALLELESLKSSGDDEPTNKTKEPKQNYVKRRGRQRG